MPQFKLGATMTRRSQSMCLESCDQHRALDVCQALPIHPLRVGSQQAEEKQRHKDKLHWQIILYPDANRGPNSLHNKQHAAMLLPTQRVFWDTHLLCPALQLS